MGENSNIAWTDHTFNPWIGCTKVSPGCDHCYAEAFDQRFNGGIHWGPGAPRRRTTVQNWNKVRRWNKDTTASGKRPRVFCASLADVFDNEVPLEWRTDLWRLIKDTPSLDWILVTKRVGNVARMAPGMGFPPNVIILATIVDQPEANRDGDKLVELKRRGIVSNIGVSYEPALGYVTWLRWVAYLDWLIVGGESAQGGACARRFRIFYAEEAIRETRNTRCAVFIKQMGSDPVDDYDRPVDLKDRAGANPDEWRADLRVRQFPVIGGNHG